MVSETVQLLRRALNREELNYAEFFRSFIISIPTESFASPSSLDRLLNFTAAATAHSRCECAAASWTD
jgi:hypothetical protein